MTAEQQSARLTLTASMAADLAALITTVDEILHSDPLVADDLAVFLTGRGHP